MLACKAIAHLTETSFWYSFLRVQIKFSVEFTLYTNKLEHLFAFIQFHTCLMFACKVRANLTEASFWYSFLRVQNSHFMSILSANVRLGQTLATVLTLYKAGLIDTFKIVQSINFWCQCYKTFFVSELQSNSLENFSLKVCNKGQGLYSQHFIFFVTYKWAQLASVCSWQTFQTQCYVTLQLIGPVSKLR